jgi:hypothetical protein
MKTNSTKARGVTRTGHDCQSFYRKRRVVTPQEKAERIGLCAVQTLKAGHVALAVSQFQQAATIYLNATGRE